MIVNSQNKLLLVMFIACTGMFLFFPYLAIYVSKIIGLDETSTGNLIGMSIVTGQVLALVMSIQFNPKRLKERKLFILSLVTILLSITGFIILPFSLFSTSALMVFLLTMIYRFSISLYANSSRALCLALTDNENVRLTFNRVKLVNSVASGVGPLIGQWILANHSYGALFTSSLILFLSSLILVLTIKKEQVSAAPIEKKYKKSPLKEKWFILASVSGFFHYLFEAQIYTYFLYYGHKLLENPTSVIFFTNSIALILIGLAVTKVQFERVSSVNMSVIGTGLSAIACFMVPFIESIGLLTLSVILLSLGEYFSPQSRLEYISEGGGDVFSRISYHNFIGSTLGLSAGFSLGGYVFNLDSKISQSLIWTAIALTSISILLMSNRLRSPSKVTLEKLQ